MGEKKIIPACRKRSFILEGGHGRELDHESYGIDEEVDGRLPDDLDEQRMVDDEVSLVDHRERAPDGQHRQEHAHPHVPTENSN